MADETKQKGEAIYFKRKNKCQSWDIVRDKLEKQEWLVREGDTQNSGLYTTEKCIQLECQGLADTQSCNQCNKNRRPLSKYIMNQGNGSLVRECVVLSETMVLVASTMLGGSQGPGTPYPETECFCIPVDTGKHRQK